MTTPPPQITTRLAHGQSLHRRGESRESRETMTRSVSNLVVEAGSGSTTQLLRGGPGLRSASRCHYRLQSRTSHHIRRHITSRWILILCPGEEPEDHWPDTSHCPIPHSSTSAHLPNYFITFVLFCSYYINYVIQLFHCAFFIFF